MKSISVNELNELLTKQSDLQLLDVRQPDEYKAGHINQALNVPLDTIDTFNGEKDKPVYVICRSGVRSSQAQEALAKAGYQVTNIDGGMLAWEENQFN